MATTHQYTPSSLNLDPWEGRQKVGKDLEPAIEGHADSQRETSTSSASTAPVVEVKASLLSKAYYAHPHCLELTRQDAGVKE